MALDEELSKEEGEEISKRMERLLGKALKANGFDVVYFGDRPSVVGRFPSKALKTLNDFQEAMGDLLVELVEAERKKRRPIAYTKHGHTVNVASAADVQALEEMIAEARVIR